MIFPWSKDNQKAEHFERKGDRLSVRTLFRKAYESYKKAAYYSESIHLYEKLLKVMDQFKDDWSEEDFVENIYWAMKQKEHIDPTFKRIHFRAEPEFKNVTTLIQNMLKAKDSANETVAVEEIVAYGEKALYPLIEYILTFKNINQYIKKKPSDTENN